MRNNLLFLAVMAAVVLAIMLALPILGLLLLVVVGLLALLVVAFLAAPLLAKLPWFRDRLFVEQYGGRRIIRFGRRADPWRRPPDQGDAMDATFRKLPDDDEQS